MKILSLLLLLSLVVVSLGSKVLVVFPVPGKSHGILGESLVKILLSAGHEVTYVSPFPPEEGLPGLQYVDISSVAAVSSGRKRPNIAELYESPHPVIHVQHVGPMFARRALEHPAVRALLRDTERTFDVVIAEWFFSGLLAPLAEVYDCPLIWYRTSDICWQSLRLMHEGSSPAYSRDLHVDSPVGPLAFWERLYQSWLQLYVTGWAYFITNKEEVPAYREQYEEPLRMRGKRSGELEAAVYNASLMFSCSHPPLGQALAAPLSVRFVGGHHVHAPPPPLPDDLKKIMDESKNGVILYSMGSLLRGSDLPDSLKRPLVDVFARLPYTVIWKMEEPLDRLPANVHTVEWAPQQSILNHPNTVLFITHGGLLSVLEATHFAVPIVGVPIFADQFANVNQAVARGVGIRARFSEDFPRVLEESINEIMTNNSYRTNAKAASLIFRDRLTSPQSEIRHWVQLVVDTKGARHLRSPALHVSTTERLYFDLFVLLLLMLWFLTKVTKVIKVHLKSYDDSNKKND